MNVDLALHAIGMTLPPPAKPAGAYSPTVVSGNLLFISGQFPIENGQPRYVGRVGAELSEVERRAAARLAAVNVLAQIHSALGNFEQLESLLRAEGHDASAPGWSNAPLVLDAASELFNAVLGKRGRHARTAFTPDRLPFNLTVELLVVAAVQTAKT